MPDAPEWTDRFLAKIHVTDTCWLWTAGGLGNGYGAFSISWRQPAIGAHRVAWLLWNGEIPEGLCVLHRCDVRRCVRPDHLFLGTKLDNARDASAKGRCRNGGRQGILNARARLTPALVEEMLQVQGSTAEIARLYGMSWSQTDRIRKGASWSTL